MTIAGQVKSRIESFPAGYVFTLSDFGLDPSNEIALAKLLSRMVSSGKLMKVSKGKYYKPRNTEFGALKPAYEELVKDFLVKDGETIGYITGTAAFGRMGLTTQISSGIMIGVNKYRHPVTRSGYPVRFLLQENPIKEEYIDLLLILDAIKLIREIPGTSPVEACQIIINLIRGLDDARTAELERLSLKYTNYVRALTGAILDYLGRSTDIIRRSLNGVSSYTLPIPLFVLPTKNNWKINEPPRE